MSSSIVDISFEEETIFQFHLGIFFQRGPKFPHGKPIGVFGKGQNAEHDRIVMQRGFLEKDQIDRNVADGDFLRNIEEKFFVEGRIQRSIGDLRSLDAVNIEGTLENHLDVRL